MSAEEHYGKGMQHFINDQLDEAIAELMRALKVEPEHTEALHALSMSFYHKKDLENAVRYGEQLRDLDPDNAMAHTSLSMFYQAQGRIDDAEEMGAEAARLSRSSE